MKGRSSSEIRSEAVTATWVEQLLHTPLEEAAFAMKEFGPFRMDTLNQCLWRCDNSEKDERVLLTPKAFSVLRHLVEHAGRLVTQDELLCAVWPNTFVQPEVLKYQIADIRQTLGDRPKNPVFIETLPKRGYQFIAEVKEGAPLESLATASRDGIGFVGRRGALKAGEQDRSIRVVHGQCAASHGIGEDLNPILDAVAQLGHGTEGRRVVEILAAQALTWMVQFPGLLTHEHRETLQREIVGVTRGVMLRAFR